MKTNKCLFLLTLLIGIPYSAFAYTWPWTRFMNSLAEELTGPFAITVGTLAIAFAAIGLLSGHAGEGMKKILIVMLAIGILIFAPIIVENISDSLKDSRTDFNNGSLPIHTLDRAV